VLLVLLVLLVGGGNRYPLFGYHKKSYIIASAFAGTAAFTGLAALPIHTANVAALFMFLANLQVAAAVPCATMLAPL